MRQIYLDHNASTPIAVALGKACVLARDLTPMSDVQTLRDRFWQVLEEHFGDRVVLNGHPEHRLPNTLNVSFLGQTGAEILAAVPEIAASTGSACHSGRIELSPVLEAMGVAPNVGLGAIRFSLGRSTAQADVDAAAARLANAIASAGAEAAP